MNRIIDVSHWSQPIDWAKVKAAGVDGVYIKCSDGISFIDPMCQKHATAAKAQDIAVGYYHFAEPDVDPLLQANYFKTLLSTMPQSDLMPVIDIEKDTTANVSAWLQSFMDAFGSPLMLYSYQPYMDIHNINFDCPLWLAQYRTDMTLPKGWAGCDLWQFTNASVIDGMPHECDEDKPLTQAFIL
jgi:lysozyme